MPNRTWESYIIWAMKGGDPLKMADNTDRLTNPFIQVAIILGSGKAGPATAHLHPPQDPNTLSCRGRCVSMIKMHSAGYFGSAETNWPDHIWF